MSKIMHPDALASHNKPPISSDAAGSGPTYRTTETSTTPSIALNKNGIAYIVGTRMKVNQIARETTCLGYTPEDILDSHPHLSLTLIAAALDYYYIHQSEIDKQILDDDAYVERLRSEQPNPLTREMLLERQRNLAKT